MNIFTKARVAFQMIFGRLTSWDIGGGGTGKYQFKRGNEFQSSVVMAPLLWFARTMPQSGIRVRKDEVVIPDHDMTALIKRPNKFYGFNKLISATVISLLYNGNGYWAKIRDAHYKPVELWYLPHWLVKPIGTSTEYVKYYAYTPNGQRKLIDPDDIIHFRLGLDPQNPLLGLSPLSGVIREIFTDDEAANYVASILVNQGVIGVIISPSGDVPASLTDVQGIKDYIKNKYTGAGRGSPLILSRPTKVEKLTFTPNELDLGKLRNISEERVTAALGVPAAVIGFGTGVQQTKVGATMKELRIMAYDNGIIPLQESMAEDLEIQLLPDYETDLTRFDVEFNNSKARVLQENENELYERYSKGIAGGWLMISEVRAKLGWEITDDQNIYLRPMNLIETPGSVPGGKAIGEITLKSGGKSRLGQIAIEVFVQMYRSYLKIVEKYEKIQERAFKDYANKVADIFLEEAGKAGIKTVGDDVVVNTTVDRAGIETVKSEVLPFKPLYLETAVVTVETLNATMKLGLNLTDAAETAIMDVGGKRMGLIDLTADTKSQMFKIIKQMRDDGKGVDEIARAIRKNLPAGRFSSPAIRAKVIARTEAKYAQNYSSLRLYRESSDIQRVQIVDGQLATSCAPCIERNGEIISFDEADEMMGDEHPNGTLSFLPVLEAEGVIT